MRSSRRYKRSRINPPPANRDLLYFCSRNNTTSLVFVPLAIAIFFPSGDHAKFQIIPDVKCINCFGSPALSLIEKSHKFGDPLRMSDTTTPPPPGAHAHGTTSESTSAVILVSLSAFPVSMEASAHTASPAFRIATNLTRRPSALNNHRVRISRAIIYFDGLVVGPCGWHVFWRVAHCDGIHLVASPELI